MPFGFNARRETGRQMFQINAICLIIYLFKALLIAIYRLYMPIHALKI